MERYDVAIAGAGIIGLAHAYHCAKRGLRVVVLERHPRAIGASIRNFGMLWPIGQPLGPMNDLARRSVEIWLDVLKASGLWHHRCGSLHVAHHGDEAQVLSEFAAASGAEILTAAETVRRFPAVRSTGLHCGLWSPNEVAVDPREVIAELPDWLTREFGVTFRFDCAVTGFDSTGVQTADGPIPSERLIVCTGADFRAVAPEAFAAQPLVACKLQMMRTPAYPNFKLGTMLAAGLTLLHYKCFASCPSLPELAKRLDAELPEYRRLGIHVMASQNGAGELVLGDSHEYGADIDPFDKPAIDDLILAYLARFVEIPDLRIAARWHGIYVKHPTEPFLIAKPRPGLIAVSAVGGAGMTLSFGLAERVITELTEELK